MGPRYPRTGSSEAPGPEKNPYLDVKLEPLGLSPGEVDAIVAFLESLEGEGHQDKAPRAFPQ